MKQINADNAPYVIDLERWSKMSIFDQIADNLSLERYFMQYAVASRLNN